MMNGMFVIFDERKSDNNTSASRRWTREESKVSSIYYIQIVALFGLSRLLPLSERQQSEPNDTRPAVNESDLLLIALRCPDVPSLSTMVTKKHCYAGVSHFFNLSRFHLAPFVPVSADLRSKSVASEQSSSPGF